MHSTWVLDACGLLWLLAWCHVLNLPLIIGNIAWQCQLAMQRATGFSNSEHQYTTQTAYSPSLSFFLLYACIYGCTQMCIVIFSTNTIDCRLPIEQFRVRCVSGQHLYYASPRVEIMSASASSHWWHYFYGRSLKSTVIDSNS